MPSKIRSETSAGRILFDRLYKGRPRKIVRLRQTMADMALGDQIRLLRQQAHLTQAQLARKIGTPTSQVSRIEDADYQGHSVATLRRVADALHKSLRIDFVEPGADGRRKRDPALSASV